MGSPPPDDAPPPAEQEKAVIDAGFQAGPPAALLCGFALPSFKFSFGFNLDFPFEFPPPLPFPFLSLGLDCNLDNPLSVDAGLKSGGGRVSQGPGNPDHEPDK